MAHPLMIPTELARNLSRCFLDIAKLSGDFTVMIEAMNAANFFDYTASFESQSDYLRFHADVLVPCTLEILDVNMSLAMKTMMLLMHRELFVLNH